MNMSATYEHLNKLAQGYLLLSDEERIERIRSNRWIGYTKAKQTLEKLEDLFTHPKVHRMPNLLLVGDTNNGKTMIINRFYNQHPASENEDGWSNDLPIMMIQCPPEPSESRFYDKILEKLFAPYKPSDRPQKKQFQVMHLLTQLKTKILILDEIHHMIAGSLTKQKHFLNTIKYLGNEMMIPIVAVGTKEAFNAIQTDSQLSNRFEPVFLPRWKLNDEFLKLLSSFEQVLPLKQPSYLIDYELSVKLLSMCEGSIGELSNILCKTAVLAIKKRKEQITPQLLDSIDWRRPSERKKDPT
jgi:Bacterial TniB protein